MNPENIDKLVRQALAIEAETAADAGALGFMARALALATMPHRRTDGNEFVRTNGTYTLTMLAPSKVGLPYGSIPRLLMAWLTTEAVKTKSPELTLGPTLSGFMAELGLIPAGGRWGTITRLKMQADRLFRCSVSCDYNRDNGSLEQGYRIAKSSQLWWHPKQPDQVPLWQSTVTLSGDFYDEVITSPVPIDLRALKALKRSPLALDVYVWLTYRLSYLSKKTEIPWPALQVQFGSGYPLTPQGTRDFKKKFLQALKSVTTVYPEARVFDGESGLLLKPSQPHIPAR